MSYDSVLVEEEPGTDSVVHAKLIQATMKILIAYDFRVRSSIEQGPARSLETKGDSGRVYHPDIIAQKGPWRIIAHARTRGQRGQSDKLDPGAVQFAVAELADLEASLKHPRALLVTPHGIQPEAKRLAEHFGILIAILPARVAEQILLLDTEKEKASILSIAGRFNLVF